MTIDLENILVRICSLRKLEMAFQSIKISKLTGEACPKPPNGSPLQRSSDSSVIKNLDFIYLKSWTVFLC